MTAPICGCSTGDTLVRLRVELRGILDGLKTMKREDVAAAIKRLLETTK